VGVSRAQQEIKPEVRNCIGDGGRPSEVGYQDQISNHLKRLATVVSVKEKACKTCQVGCKKMSESKLLLKRRKSCSVMSKSMGSTPYRDKVRKEPEFCSSGIRRIGGMILQHGSYVERENLELRCKGKNLSGSTARMKVPMRSGGAEQPVVAKMSGNADGAKGLPYLAWNMSQPQGRIS